MRNLHEYIELIKREKVRRSLTKKHMMWGEYQQGNNVVASRDHYTPTRQPEVQFSQTKPPIAKDEIRDQRRRGTSAAPCDVELESHFSPSARSVVESRAVSSAHRADSHPCDSATRDLLLSGNPVPLSQPTDRVLLSKYQLLIRESVLVFPTTAADQALSKVPGRKNKPEIGQVGVCCRFCRHKRPNERGTASFYYPGSTASIYQAAQNMATNHLLKTCKEIPEEKRQALEAARLQQKKDPKRSGGNSYWLETVRHLGLEDRDEKIGVWVSSRGSL